MVLSELTTQVVPIVYSRPVPRGVRSEPHKSRNDVPANKETEYGLAETRKLLAGLQIHLLGLRPLGNESFNSHFSGHRVNVPQPRGGNDMGPGEGAANAPHDPADGTAGLLMEGRRRIISILRLRARFSPVSLGATGRYSA